MQLTLERIDAHDYAFAEIGGQFTSGENVYFTNRLLAGDVGSDYGLRVSDTGLGVRIVDVADRGDAFGVANDSRVSVMQLLESTSALTDVQQSLIGFAAIYDSNGDGVIDSEEARLRSMANDLYSWINRQ